MTDSEGAADQLRLTGLSYDARENRYGSSAGKRKAMTALSVTLSLTRCAH